MGSRVNPYDEAVRLLAVGLEAGTASPHVVCPKCKGGRTGEQSLRINRSLSGRLSWTCFRASCGYSAWAAGPHTKRIYAIKQRVSRVFRGATQPLSQAQVQWLTKRFDFTAAELTSAGILLVPDSKSTYWPVRGNTGMHRGAVLRSFATGMKANNYREDIDSPWLAWYPHHDSQDTIIVEDQLSALKGSRVANAVSLMGTLLSLEKLMEIVSNTNNNILLLLDADATAKAVKFLRRFSWLGNLTVKPLAKDLKYYTTEEIEELI